MAARKTASSRPARRTAKARTTRPSPSRPERPTQSRTQRESGSPRRTRSTGARKSAKPRRWSRQVMESSDALDLQPNVFKRGSARQIALSLKRSAERSQRRKSTPFRSAMSMLNFYINRGGKNLSPTRLRVLERAKDELRDVFHRERG